MEQHIKSLGGRDFTKQSMRLLESEANPDTGFSMQQSDREGMKSSTSRGI